MTEHVDVLIIGAGLSGIGAACWLTMRAPKQSFAVLESREAIGGTWDLFRYPGVRSDSDMYTLGYSFRPWRDAKAIADGPAILSYVRETADAYGVTDKIRFRHRVVEASWDSRAALWTVTAERADAGDRARLTARFLMVCSGYYRYDRGHAPDFPGRERFKGRIVHPQFWPGDLDHAGKQVVVIGSGATAITIVPEMAKTAARVTMLQRTPTYIFARPQRDAFANFLRDRLPARFAHSLARWKNILPGMYFYGLSRRKPEIAKKMLVRHVRRQLGPTFDIGRDFTPPYNPWEQRLCLAPDGDFFSAMHRGKAFVQTGAVETFTETGVRLASGQELPADIVVTATGLDLVFLGGVSLVVDGQPVDPAQRKIYKGMMLEGVPNLVSVFGYTNASWTLKADLTCQYVCRLLNYMDRRGVRSVTPRDGSPEGPLAPLLDFSSGYVQRGMSRFPKQGSRAPWRMNQNYILDLLSLRLGRVSDPALDFEQPPKPPEALAQAEAAGT
jgi:monooxygenase